MNGAMILCIVSLLTLQILGEFQIIQSGVSMRDFTIRLYVSGREGKPDSLIHSLKYWSEGDKFVFVSKATGTGWVALGLNEKAVLHGAELVLAGVSNSSIPYYAIRKVVGNDTNSEYPGAAWTFLTASEGYDASEGGVYTTFTAERQKVTSDNRDFQMVKGTTMYLYLAFGATDDFPSPAKWPVYYDLIIN